MRLRIAVVMGLICALILTGCGSSEQPPGSPGAQEITLWLIQGSTPKALQNYLISEYANINGGQLIIREQPRVDMLTMLETQLPYETITPDVFEITNTWTSRIVSLGYVSDLSDLYTELGGTNLLQSFVDAGMMDSAYYTLPYYFEPKFVLYRKDIWRDASLTKPPKTLSEFGEMVIAVTEKNPRAITEFSGLLLDDHDWRTGMTWVYANGGELVAMEEDGTWVSTLSDPATIQGILALREIQQNASRVRSNQPEAAPWLHLNDTEKKKDEDGNLIGMILTGATVLAPGWAVKSLGDVVKNEAGHESRVWNEDTFGVFALPGEDGNPAPLLLGGSTIAIAKKSENQEGARQLLQIIFSREFQTMLAQNGLGPGNTTYFDALGTDQFARAARASGTNVKLPPAAPNWAKVETAGVLEDFFHLVAQGGNVEELAAEYDRIITDILNRK